MDEETHKILFWVFVTVTALIESGKRLERWHQELARNPVHTRQEAGDVHFEVGQAVRSFIIERGATLPEDLPTPAQSITQLERAEQKRLADEMRESRWQLEGDVE